MSRKLYPGKQNNDDMELSVTGDSRNIHRRYGTRYLREDTIENPDDRSRKRFLLADSCPITLMGMKEFLRASPGTKVLGEARSAEETVRLAEELEPDYVVLDPRFDSSGEFCVEICRKLKALPGLLQVVVYTHHDEPSGVAAALLAGANHFVHKGLNRVKIEQIRGQIVAGKRVVRPGFYTGGHEFPYLIATYNDRLTHRQQQVFERLIKRHTNAEIARELYISKQTARNYVGAVFRECEVKNRAQFHNKFSV